MITTRKLIHTITVGSIALASLTSIGASPVSAAELPADEQQQMLDAHNNVRSRVAAAETERLGATVTIPDLVWDVDAAAAAQAWAEIAVANPNSGTARTAMAKTWVKVGAMTSPTSPS